MSKPNTKYFNQTIDSAVKKQLKFMRRTDLTPSVRLHIACTALMAQTFGEWGAITALARQFMISRTFVYMLAAALKETENFLFGGKINPQPLISHRVALAIMLSLRMEGRCSLQAISTIMKRLGLKITSVGSISQYLAFFGALLPNTLTTDSDIIQMVVFLSDEIFSKDTPILVTVDSVSSAILRIELADSRKAEEWKNHWKCLEENGIFAAYLVCDEGKGLCSAKEEAMPEVIRQSDTYHAIAHVLGLWVTRLEKAACGAIENEYKCFKNLDSARSEKVINKRIERFEIAEKEAIEAITLYDSFQFLYSYLLEQLCIFDENGELRDREQAEENIKIGLDLIETLGKSSLTAPVNKVRRTLPNLFHYFDVAIEVVEKLEKQGIDKDVLCALCLAWQWNKGRIKAKKANRVQLCTGNERDCLEFTIGHLQEDYEDVKEQVYGELDKIVQSSALVECINSIIRPYLDSSKNHITQETLNLIMFYHNHRRYRAGKRQGKTPMEILNGKEQEKDWIELLFEIVEQKDPSFFISQ